MTFKRDKGFTIAPSVPKEWKNYNITYTRGKCIYNIEVAKDGEKGIWLDDNKIHDEIIPFLECGRHQVKVNI
jgi:cellobiose phosphorylase